MSDLETLCTEIANCGACSLAKTRVKVVPGEGPQDADIMFIGEAPGYHENQQGRPFIGPAGRFLDELLESIDLSRSKVFIGNVIKCRPPNNRDPLPDEINACAQWLDRQIEIIKPKIIVTLGRYSMAKFFPGETIGKIHGSARKTKETIYFAMYHPAAALHQQSLKKTLLEDIKKLPPLLEEIRSSQAQPEKPTEQPKQLSLF